MCGAPLGGHCCAEGLQGEDNMGLGVPRVCLDKKLSLVRVIHVGQVRVRVAERMS